MSEPAQTYDFIIVGAGSAGCAVAWQLSKMTSASVCVLEGGRSDAVANVKVPFGLLYTMGSGRDWRYQTAPQRDADGRSIKVPRGAMLGGSSSINSMVWFRGRQDDFDAWDVPGWSWSDVEPHFEDVESLLTPQRLPDPHPLSNSFARALGDNGKAPPTPERESAGVVHVNMRNGRRWSAADAFLRPAQKSGRVHVKRKAVVDRLILREGRAIGVKLCDGRSFQASRGVVLSAGAIASPAILMRSGLGPAAHLQGLGIAVEKDIPGIGANLHDHPAVGVHHEGAGSGYGLVMRQLPAWALSPLQWLVNRQGRMTSNFVEAGAFMRAGPVSAQGDHRPDVQVHFIPYMMGYRGKAITWGEGYFADVCICRPKSRGRLTLASANPLVSPDIDLGLFSDSADMDLLVAGLKRLRALLAQAPFEGRKAPEVYPGEVVKTDESHRAYIRKHCGTAYHPVGTVRLGAQNTAPLDPKLRLKGIDGLWVADASVMPSITSANTNAPSMMIGHRAGALIAKETR